MYETAAQPVILYGGESRAVTGEMCSRSRRRSTDRAAQRITGMTAKRGAGGGWEYPSVEEAMEDTGIHPVGVYIKRRQTNISERVACRPVYALCTEAERMPGTSRMVRWWDQDAVNKPEE